MYSVVGSKPIFNWVERSKAIVSEGSFHGLRCFSPNHFENESLGKNNLVLLNFAMMAFELRQNTD